MSVGQSIKELMAEHVRTMGQIHQAQLELLRTSLARQQETVSTAVRSVAGKIDGGGEKCCSDCCRMP
jgi:hypothetical protein